MVKISLFSGIKNDLRMFDQCLSGVLLRCNIPFVIFLSFLIGQLLAVEMGVVEF